jgi:DNA-binding response OmpR family regulator
MKVLIVDDDPDFCYLTTRGLEQAGIEHRAARTAQEARDLLRGPDAGTFDVVLLDIELPGTKGWEFLSELRTNGHEVPVMFVTVRQSPEDRVQGLNLGADDYVVKPFDPAELVARLHAVVRRNFRGEKIRIQDLTIDPYLRRIERNGKPIDLTPREFDILWALAQSSGRTVSEKELLKRLWGMEFDPETNFVQVHVFRLRKKLDRAGKPLIDTVRGVGYRLRV